MNKPSIRIGKFIEELKKLDPNAFVKVFEDDVEMGVVYAGEMLESSGTIHKKKDIIIEARKAFKDSITKRFTK